MSAAQRLAELIRIPTVSANSSADEDNELFLAFPDCLAGIFPAAHKAMQRELVGDRAILYKWEGSDPGLEPVLGLAHFDVVPPGEDSAWKIPPFSGTLEGGRIHGRGSLDDKGMLASWMEAVDRMALSGFKPQRTLYLAFGGDEETTGTRGGGRISKLLEKRGIHFAFILDEGGAITTDQLSSFTDKPVALVGVAEKGYLTVRIVAKGMGGHASSPPKHTAIGRLGQTIAALEASPFKPRMTEAPAGMLRALGQVARGVKSVLLKNPYLFSSILSKTLSTDTATAPLVRTTLAPTVLSGGERANVLPNEVEALVNLRLLPGDSINAVVRRIEGIIEKTVDGGVSVHIMDGSAFEPVPFSGASGKWWDKLGGLIEKNYPGTVVAPFLMTGTTDSRWYRNLSENIYRFIPLKVDTSEMNCVHAANESISEANWLESVNFTENLLTEALGK